MAVPPPPRDHRSRFDRRTETVRAGDRGGELGVYRRRIHLRHQAAGLTIGELEDDFHHFSVSIHHDGETVTDVSAEGIRHPWDICAEADQPIRAVIGTAVIDQPTVLGDLDARANCTHLFDLTGLTVAHAARTAPERTFDAEVGDLGPDRQRDARLWVDGDLTVEWRLSNRDVIGPERWAGIPLWKGFMRWALAELDPSTAEAAIVLRRAVDISRGRTDDLDRYRSNAELAGFMTGVCHAYTEANKERGVRLTGSALDFTDRPELLLADFDDRRID